MNNNVYKGDYKKHVVFPLGGIGTGSLGITANGRLTDWEIFNYPEKGENNGYSHFAIKAESNGKVIDSRILNGEYNEGNAEGSFKDGLYGRGVGVSLSALAGMPHFKNSHMTGTFPSAEINFQDDKFPANISLLAFSPFIPLNSDDSSIPTAMFEFEIENTSEKTIDYTLAGVLANPHEADGYHRTYDYDEHSAIWLQQTRKRGEKPFGNISIGASGDDIKTQNYFYRGNWFESFIEYWNDFTTYGHVKQRIYNDLRHNYRVNAISNLDHALITSKITLKPKEKKKVKFAISWYYPSYKPELSWDSKSLNIPEDMNHFTNFYATKWNNSLDINNYVFENWERFKKDTLTFRDLLFDSTLPNEIKDATSSNLAVLRSPTVVRLPDGTLWGWEGGIDKLGACPGTCTHVWNYQQALPLLFPDLERTIREADYVYNMRSDGGMDFRLKLPLGASHGMIMNGDSPLSCADGHFGNVLKTYRDWQNGGGNSWLKKIYPATKQCLEYTWSPLNHHQWDPEKTGVLWGRQHHTLDMELFGPNSWLTSMYLGALKAMNQMALAMGENDFSQECLEIYQRGRKWVEENLFNGEYFEQQINLKDKSLIEKFAELDQNNYDLVIRSYWNEERGEIKYQQGDGCLIDQTLGQWHAHLYGLGDVLDPTMVKNSLSAIYKHNFKRNLWDFTNPCRVYAFENEQSVVINTYPETAKNKPVVPLSYSEETMTGYEYGYAGQLIYQGMLKEGLTVIGKIRERYNGKLRNPFNEIEYGNNYARSMASFGLIPAYSHQKVDLNNHTLSFDPVEISGNIPFFTASGYGKYIFNEDQHSIKIIYGTLTLKELSLTKIKQKPIIKLNNELIDYTIKNNIIHFPHKIKLTTSDILSVN